MKTEKRLTMALSVLVALMMLAVPLASSSNLFVDGGQTNSNGDAPSLSAPSEGYTITFKLNGNENSLDKATYASLGNTATWHLDEDGNLYTVVDKDSTLSTVFADLYADGASTILKIGYDLDSWKDEATGAVYGKDAASDTETKITSNMTFSAQWLLDDNYCEIPVIVDYKGETKEYVKAYPYLAGSNDKKIEIKANDSLLTAGVPGIDTYGIVVNATDKALTKPIYSFKATYGDKEFEYDSTTNQNKAVNISVDSKITIKYTFDKDNYSEIVVSSIAFKDGKDVTLYADRDRIYTYPQVFTALTKGADDGATPAGHVIKAAITIDPKITDKKVTTEGYELTGWNEGAEPLSSEKEASSPLTLDAKLNGYYVIFMSKGQYEYVYIPFGELSADKTTLDIAGVNHWVWMKYSDYDAGTFTTIENTGTIQPFNFASTKNVGDVEDKANGKVPAAVLIACFTPTSSTSYAVFDASENDGNFGNEYVDKIVIPGKVGNTISLPSSNPVYNKEDSRIIFLGWDRVAGKNSNIPADAEKPGVYTSTDKYDQKDKVNEYAANPQDYKYKITFYDGSNVVGVLYYETNAPTNSLMADLVAFEYDGNVYNAADLKSDDTTTDAYKSAKKIYDGIVTPDKAGYYITQWNDADKNKVIEFKWTNGKLDETGTKVDIKDMKDDLNLYAQFEAKEYVIQYKNTYNGATSTQTVKVDETVKLYGDSTFVYNGYKLTGWSDRPDGEGNKYDLGASFTLNGEQFEGLDGSVLSLYAVWEKSGSSSGDNTDGGNDNTALYLIAGMLAVIAILAIVGIVLMRRK